MDIVRHIYPTLLAWMRPAVTGIIGLTIFALLRYGGQGNNNENVDRNIAGDVNPRQPSQATSSHGSKRGHVVKRDNPIAEAVTASLPNQSINRLVISLTAALMQPGGSSSSSVSRSLDSNVAEVIRELCFIVPEVYFVSQVSSDHEAESVTTALTSSDLLSLTHQAKMSHQGSVPSQRLLLCSKPEGKIAIVRQLEPDLYIDSDQAAVAELARFLPRVWSISNGMAMGSQFKAELRSAPSLAALFKL